MEWVLVVMQIMPYVIELIKIVEKLFADDAKSGPNKKELVQTAVKALIADKPDAVMVKTMAAVDPLVDIAAAYLFPHEEGVKS